MLEVHNNIKCNNVHKQKQKKCISIVQQFVAILYIACTVFNLICFLRREGNNWVVMIEIMAYCINRLAIGSIIIMHLRVL